MFLRRVPAVLFFGVLLLGAPLLSASPAGAQPTFTNAVLPSGVPAGASGSNVVTSTPQFFDPASGDYRPDKPARSPLVDLAGGDVPRDGRLLNGQTQTESGWDAGALESNGSALPVDLIGLEATLSEGRGGQQTVRLTWTTASETRNAGFRVQRRVDDASALGARQAAKGPQDGGSSQDAVGAEWTTLGYVEGAGTTSRQRSYRFVDEEPPFAAGRLRYRLVQEDIGGGTETSDPVVLERPAPSRLTMRPPAPNPARSETTVELAFPDAQPATEARLAVFDVLGREVARRVLEARSGYRRAVRFGVAEWPSGLYFVRLTVGQTTRTERLTVVR